MERKKKRDVNVLSISQERRARYSHWVKEDGKEKRRISIKLKGNGKKLIKVQYWFAAPDRKRKEKVA